MYISYGLVKTFAEIFCTTMVNSSCQKALHFKASVNFSKCTAKWVSCIPFYTFAESARIFSFTVSNEMIKQNVACWTGISYKIQLFINAYLCIFFSGPDINSPLRWKGNTVHQHLGNSIRIYRYFKYHCIAKKKTIDGNGSFFLILSRSFGEWKLKYEYLQ